MTEINVSAPRQQWPQPSAKPAAAPAAVQPAAGGTLSVSPEAAEAATLRFAIEAGGRVTGADERGLRALIAECATAGARSGLSSATKASVHLVAAGAYGRLAELGIDKQENGTHSFGELASAHKLAPQAPAVAISYARTMLAFNELNFFAKPFVEGHLGIKISAETGNAMAQLKKLPDDGMAQLVLQQLAKAVGDTNSAKEAEANLARIKQQGGRIPDASELSADAQHGDKAQAK